MSKFKRLPEELRKYRVGLLSQEQEKAYKLYKEGLSLRDVGKILKRSHEWVRGAIRKDMHRAVDKS